MKTPNVNPIFNICFPTTRKNSRFSRPYLSLTDIKIIKDIIWLVDYLHGPKDLQSNFREYVLVTSARTIHIYKYLIQLVPECNDYD